jgi:His-Xaa-Ser system protein HxsD
VKRIDIDAKERSAAFAVPRKIYTMDALRIAAQVLSTKVDVYLAESKSSFAVTLKAKRRDADEAALRALAGEFGNELLNQEYRFIVGRFNQKISSLIVTQALMAARGGVTPAGPPPEEAAPAFQAAVAEMVRNAEAEVARTMPKKLPPQGTPLPPFEGDAGV